MNSPNFATLNKRALFRDDSHENNIVREFFGLPSIPDLQWGPMEFPLKQFDTQRSFCKMILGIDKIPRRAIATMQRARDSANVWVFLEGQRNGKYAPCAGYVAHAMPAVMVRSMLPIYRDTLKAYTGLANALQDESGMFPETFTIAFDSEQARLAMRWTYEIVDWVNQKPIHRLSKLQLETAIEAFISIIESYIYFTWDYTMKMGPGASLAAFENIDSELAQAERLIADRPKYRSHTHAKRSIAFELMMMSSSDESDEDDLPCDKRFKLDDTPSGVHALDHRNCQAYLVECGPVAKKQKK